MRNVGTDTVASVRLALEQYGQVVDDPNADLQLYDDLAPGESGTATTMLVYNGYVEWQSGVRYGTVTPLLREVVVARGGTMESLQKLSGWEEYVEQAPPPDAPAPPRSEART